MWIKYNTSMTTEIKAQHWNDKLKCFMTQAGATYTNWIERTSEEARRIGGLAALGDYPKKTRITIDPTRQDPVYAEIFVSGAVVPATETLRPGQSIELTDGQTMILRTTKDPQDSPDRLLIHRQLPYTL